MMPPGHVRTPAYLRGKIGAIERPLGSFGNPEQLAYRQPSDPVPLYRVRFLQTHEWPGYAGPANDVIEMEIYEHWLEPVNG